LAREPAIGQVPSPGKGWRRLLRRPASPGDWLFRAATLLAGLSLVAVLAAMAASLLDSARPSISAFGLGFLFRSIWDPVREVFGALPAIYGTLLTSAIAMAVALPVSLGVAIFLAELAPRWLRTTASFLVEMLAAIPSVVLGLWGIFVMAPAIYPAEKWLERVLGFIPLFHGPIFGGFGFLTGGLILAIMALPIITAIARDAILTVPPSQKEAMLALGATRWEVISGAILPYARSGVTAAAILGLGRALGETMAVTMVIGNGYQVTARLFAPGNTMASKIATQFNEASGLEINALVELALVLLAVALIVNVVGRLLVRRAVGRVPWGGR
jgi:phosphate transport system permease protein